MAIVNLNIRNLTLEVNILKNKLVTGEKEKVMFDALLSPLLNSLESLTM
jgi:hypothetical protein